MSKSESCSGELIVDFSLVDVQPQEFKGIFLFFLDRYKDKFPLQSFLRRSQLAHRFLG